MFTGIVEALAQVLEKGETTLTVRRPVSFTDLDVGSSVCVSGVCLTVSSCDAGSLTFDVVPETLSVTTLGKLAVGDRVNLERSLRASDRLEGHVVQGHVEGVGVVQAARERTDGSREIELTLPEDVLPFVVKKGSIALDGVSLTVVRVSGDEVTIALIPSTLRGTTLRHLKAGDQVNVETDILGRYALSSHASQHHQSFVGG